MQHYALPGRGTPEALTCGAEIRTLEYLHAAMDSPADRTGRGPRGALAQPIWVIVTCGEPGQCRAQFPATADCAAVAMGSPRPPALHTAGPKAEGPCERVYGERSSAGDSPGSPARRRRVLMRQTVRAEGV